VRSAGVATFITASPPMGQDASTENHVTGLVDSILVLRHVEQGSVVRRAVHVQRMRGSSHEETIRELNITNGQVRVGGALDPGDDKPPMP